MALVIRLRQQGRTNRRCFRLVVTDKQNPRDGKYIENLGWYDPHIAGEKNYLIKDERIQNWLDHGATISENAQSLIARAAPEVMKKWKMKAIEKKLKLREKHKKAVAEKK